MLQVGASWSHGKLNVEGLSLSGIRTAFSLPDYNIGFDVAQGFPFSINLKHHFISHAHMDHAAGIPYIISQKAMNHHSPAQFFMPSSQCSGMTKIMRLWEELEGHQYSFNFIPVDKGFSFEINKQLLVKAFPTTHRIQSFGYTLFEVKHKLKKEFANCSQNEILDLKLRKIDIQELYESPLFSFTGDTQIEFLESEPWIASSKVLFMEATYLDNRKTIAQAREWGHTHLDEIIPRLSEIHSEKIVLIHSSSRYSLKEANEILNKRIPPQYKDRVLIFPGR